MMAIRSTSSACPVALSRAAHSAPLASLASLAPTHYVVRPFFHGGTGCVAMTSWDVIIIGGSMGEHLPKYHGPLMKHLKTMESKMEHIPPIVEASDPHNAVINGCKVAMDLYAADN